MIERLFLPDGFDEMSPGPELAALLAVVDRSRLNGHDLVRAIRARSRQVAHEQAGLLADVAELRQCGPGGSDAPVSREGWRDSRQLEIASMELSAALTLTRAGADCQLGLAIGLAALPALGKVMADGLLDQARVQIIVTALNPLPPEQGAAVLELLLPDAPRLTSGQLRARLATLIIGADPDAAGKRYRRAVAERRLVRGCDEQTHTAYLAGSDLPADRAAKAWERVNAIAQDLKRGGDERGMDQLRADVYLDLLEGNHLPVPAAARCGVTDVSIQLTTLAGLAGNPGLIPGWGPVLADIARQVARENPTWRYRVTDPEGRLLREGRIAMPKTTVAGEYAFVKARDRHCRFPTCRTPARSCDVDHTIQRRRGGQHTRTNLSLECRRHHRGKDELGFGLTHLDQHGRLQWTTPQGHTYQSQPDDPFAGLSP